MISVISIDSPSSSDSAEKWNDYLSELSEMDQSDDAVISETGRARFILRLKESHDEEEDEEFNAAIDAIFAK